MSQGDILLVSLAAGLVIIAGVVACVGAAMGRVTRPAVEELVRNGRPGAPTLHRLLADAARTLNLLLLLRTMAEIGGVVCATLVIVHARGEGFVSLVLAATLMSVVSFVVIGVAARTLGRRHAIWVALHSAGPVRQLTAVLGPLPRLLIAFGNAVTPGPGYPEGPFASEAELRGMVDLAQERGVVDRHERDLINSVFELDDTLVREVMVPRTDMVTIERGKTIKQALVLALRSGYSRIPVTGDGADDIVGIAYLKDMARRSADGRAAETVEVSARTALYVPDSKPVDEVLREMQARRVHLAVVVDEYGGTAGLVTIEDILEEIVGEITDEYDTLQPPVEEVDGGYRVTARLPVADLEALYGVRLAVEDVDSVGGLLASALGRVPIPGASVDVGGLRLVAEAGKGRRHRVSTVLVTRSGPQPEAARA